MHEAAFKLHISEMIETYQKVVILNLLDSSNNYELALIKFYEFLLKKYKEKLKKSLKYQYINYKKDLASNNIESVQALKTVTDVMKYLWINPTKNVLSRQKCVIRLNSLNCLHRTNRCQLKIANHMLKSIMAQLDEKKVISKDKLKWSYLEDKIENLYKATGAKLCIESGCHCITNKKPEERSYLSAMYSQVTSIEKYFTNYLTSIQSKEDNLYQEALEYVRGINVSHATLFENSVQKQLLEVESKYSRIKNYRFGMLTWNLAGQNMDEGMDLENTLLSSNDEFNDPPDIYFTGFQETRKLNAMALLKGASKSRVSKLFNFNM